MRSREGRRWGGCEGTSRSLDDQDLKKVQGGTSLFGNCCSHGIAPRPRPTLTGPTQDTSIGTLR